MNNNPVTSAVNRIKVMTTPSHLFAGSHESEHQAQTGQAKKEHGRQPDDQVHWRSPQKAHWYSLCTFDPECVQDALRKVRADRMPFGTTKLASRSSVWDH